MIKKQVIVGGSFDDAAKRFVETFDRAARGEPVEAQDNVTFASWSTLSAVMTDKRHELLRHLHSHPAHSIRALARDLGRDYKRVHDDVAALVSVGLVEKDGRTLRVDYAEIRSVIAV
jgi:predicted transcriptional regulator